MKLLRNGQKLKIQINNNKIINEQLIKKNEESRTLQIELSKAYGVVELMKKDLELLESLKKENKTLKTKLTKLTKEGK